jgi:predicted nucleotidyltransferase
MQTKNVLKNGKTGESQTMNENGEFGLTKTLNFRLRELFDCHPEVERVWIYGSRALNSALAGSDIDLALEGEGLTHQSLLRLSAAIDDLLLPYKLDLSLFQSMDGGLREEIMRTGKLFHENSSPSHLLQRQLLSTPH